MMKGVAKVARGEGQVQIIDVPAPLISDKLPITEWRQAFDIFEQRRGLKIILTPVN